MSELNQCRYGSLDAVLHILDGDYEATALEWRAALLNALCRIAELEKRVSALDDPLARTPTTPRNVAEDVCVWHWTREGEGGYLRTCDGQEPGDFCDHCGKRVLEA